MHRISTTLASALIAGLVVPVAMGADAAADSGPCPNAAAPTSGSGTSASPFLIASESNLQWMRDRVNGGANDEYYLQTANLDFGGCIWSTAIGNVSLTGRFEGFYDGDGHIVEGLDISAPDRSGLFGAVDLDNTVGGNTNGISIRDLGFTGDVSMGSSTASTKTAGGLVGYLYQGSITGSFSSGRVSSGEDGARVGGLVGYAASASSEISNSYATGRVETTGSTLTNTATGGLVGHLSAAMTITDSYATGAVSSVSTWKGGLIGRQQAVATINDSYYNSDVIATSFGGTPKTTAEMTDASTFVTGGWPIASGWDADSATTPWGICSAVNDGYPFLNVFYSSDPCSSTPAAAGGAVPDWPVFTFQTPGGGQCTDISPQHPRLNSWFTLPDADAPCFIKGSVITGWSIPGQDWAFAPGRRVWVVDSQTFTSVLEYEWVTIEYDSNVDAKDACLADGVDLPVPDRTGITHIPRGVISDQLLWNTPVCSAPAYEFLGWTTDNPYNDPTVLPKDGTMPAPAVNNDGDAANVIHLYAMWKYIG